MTIPAGIEAFDDPLDDLPVRVELAALFARTLCELLDQIHVGVAQDVGRHVAVPQPVLLEVGQKPLQPRVGEVFLIGEVHLAEHTAQTQINFFNRGEGIVQVLADLGCVLSDRIPVVLGGL